jgi:hypothetical protein
MLARLRPLIVLAALFALALTAAAPAGAAKAPPRCAKGKVRLVKGAPCVKVTRAQAGVPAALRDETRLRKVAGPRGVKRAQALATALAAATAPRKVARAAKARAHASEVVDLPDGEWHDIDLNGVPGRQRTTEVVQEGATPTQVMTVEAEAVQKVDGATITVTTSARRTISLEACPDANGVAHGTWEMRKIERREVAKAGKRAFVETRTTTRGDATVQVGDDAKIASGTYDGTVDLEVRATGASTRRYLVTWTAPADLPQSPSSRFEAALKRDPAGALAGQYRGPKGSRLTDEEMQGLASLRAGEQFLLEDGLKDVLRLMEQSWNSMGRCLDVVLDPPSAAMAPGETKTFTATAKAKDGTPVGGATKAIMSPGTVTPETATMTPGTPLKLDVTMGDKDKAYLIVDVTTKRGLASTMIEIPRVSGWDVTFTAKGSYAMQQDHGTDTDAGTADLSWTTTFHAVRLDGGQYDPFGQTAIAGTMSQHGTLGTGTYTCSGTPWVMQTYNSTITPTPAAGGAYAIRILPFTAVLAERSSEQCTRAGYGGDYGHIDGITSAQPYEAHLTVTPEQLASGDFTVPVRRDADFHTTCDVGAICSEDGDMTGTVHFVRR